MNLPSFDKFKESIDFDKLDYDIERHSTPLLKQSSSLFTQEQYTFICQTMAALNLAMLQQYHQWLSEQLP